MFHLHSVLATTGVTLFGVVFTLALTVDLDGWGVYLWITVTGLAGSDG